MIPHDDNPTATALRIRVEILIGRIGNDLEAMRRRIDTLAREQHPTSRGQTVSTGKRAL